MVDKIEQSRETKNYTYVLRTCKSNLQSYGGFQWPSSGPVEAPDWDPGDHCGQGLHGFLLGVGDGALADWNPQAKWLVVRVFKDELVEITEGGVGKVKFPRGEVVFVGGREEAIARLESLEPLTRQMPVVGARRTSGDYGQATAGYQGQATSGYQGQATSGDHGQATSGVAGQATAGYEGQATSGYGGQATSGDSGQATSGDHGQATSGNYGQATAGEYGQATSGVAGQATAGYQGQATSGNGGQATSGYRGQSISGNGGQATSGDYGESFSREGRVRAGPGGILYVSWMEGAGRNFLACKVGEMDTKPNTWYRLSEDRKSFVECTDNC